MCHITRVLMCMTDALWVIFNMKEDREHTVPYWLSASGSKSIATSLSGFFLIFLHKTQKIILYKIHFIINMFHTCKRIISLTRQLPSNHVLWPKHDHFSPDNLTSHHFPFQRNISPKKALIPPPSPYLYPTPTHRVTWSAGWMDNRRYTWLSAHCARESSEGGMEGGERPMEMGIVH